MTRREACWESTRNQAAPTHKVKPYSEVPRSVLREAASERLIITFILLPCPRCALKLTTSNIDRHGGVGTRAEMVNS